MWGDADIRASRLGTVYEHGDEDDILHLVELAEPSGDDIALDLVTGLGHVARALAPRVARVDALDPDGEMLREAESLAREHSLTNMSFIEADPTSLPCESGSYDIVTARMALRHLGDGVQFVREVHRVIKPTGRFLITDSLAPPHADLESFQKNLMSIRDPSHVKSYSLAELEGLLERESFDIDLIEIYPKEHDFDSWAKRLGADHDIVRMIAKMLQSASARAKRHFRVVEKADDLVSFVTWMILVRARPALES